MNSLRFSWLFARPHILARAVGDFENQPAASQRALKQIQNHVAITGQSRQHRTDTAPDKVHKHRDHCRNKNYQGGEENEEHRRQFRIPNDAAPKQNDGRKGRG